MCTRVNADDFYTVHHELGHNFYQRAYAKQPYLFRGGANDGFHEAIGDFVGLSALTPTYLKQVGIIDAVPGADADIPYLLNMAMDKIAFLPFGLLVDKWRWQVFSGQVDPAHYNEAWWKLRTQYQGVTPPGPRPADAFDPGAKFHVADSTPSTRYLLAQVYQFQFGRAACRPGRLEGSAEPLLGLWRQGGGREVRGDDGHGPVQAPARGRWRPSPARRTWTPAPSPTTSPR